MKAPAWLFLVGALTGCGGGLEVDCRQFDGDSSGCSRVADECFLSGEAGEETQCLRRCASDPEACEPEERCEPRSGFSEPVNGIEEPANVVEKVCVTDER